METDHPAPLIALLKETTTAVVLCDEGGQIVLWNKGAGDIFGYTPEEIIRQSVVKIFPQKYIPLLNETRYLCEQAALAQGKTIHSMVLGRDREFNAVRKNGEEFACEVSIVCYNEGEQRVFLAFVYDLSQGVLGLLKNVAQRLETIDHRLDTLERISGVL